MDGTTSGRTEPVAEDLGAARKLHIVLARTGLSRFGSFRDRAIAALTLIVFATFVLVAPFRPELAVRLAAKDGHDGAFIEIATVVVLLPGIGIGLAGLALRRTAAPWVRVWLALWTLAAIFFASEECSWGQWIWGWETPAAVAGLNRQGETNLHNISTWLNQKPQAFGEIFIFLAGVVLPALALIDVPQSSSVLRGGRASWILAAPSLIPAGPLHGTTKVCCWLVGPQRLTLGAPEVQEFAIAWFMTLYLWSLVGRMGQEITDIRAISASPAGS